MKISRSYLMGLGSGLILSALIALIMPPITINFGSNPPSQQNVSQGEQGVNREESNQEETNQEETNQEETNQGTVDGDNGEGKGSNGEAPGLDKENNNEAGAEKDSEIKKDTEGEKEPFVIPRGSTASQIADLLFKEGWISSKEEFMAVVEERNLATKFRAGTYQLTRGLDIVELLAELID